MGIPPNLHRTLYNVYIVENVVEYTNPHSGSGYFTGKRRPWIFWGGLVLLARIELGVPRTTFQLDHCVPLFVLSNGSGENLEL